MNKNLICNYINSAQKSVVIVSHTSPDGDSIGSSLAMFSVLKSFGHDVRVIFPDIYPEYYSWLPWINEAIIAEIDFEKAESYIMNSTMQIILDMNSLKRAAKLQNVLSETKATRLLIDHHILNNNEFDAVFSTPNVSSTCELVFEIIEELDANLITKDVAKCLYTGIVTDTANFFHGNMTPKTFEITAELMKRGIDIREINQVLYHNFSENRIRLLGFCISERLVVMRDVKASFIYLNKEDLEKFNYSEGDSEDIVNYGLAIKGIHISAFFIEKPKYIKISLRSEGNIDVNELAFRCFKGGGHKNASGAHFYGSINEAMDIFKNAIKNL